MIYASTIVFYSPLKLVFGFLPYYQLWRFGFYIMLFHPKIDLTQRVDLGSIKKRLKRRETAIKEVS